MWQLFRSSLLIALGVTLLGCSRENLPDSIQAQVLERLSYRAESPFACRIERRGIRNRSGAPEEIEYSIIFDYLGQNKNSSAYLFEERYEGFEMTLSFTEHSNGRRHLKDEGADSWGLCGKWPFETPLSSFGIFEKGGWSLMAQAKSLIETYNPTKIEVTKSGVEMIWNPLPGNLQEDLLRTFDLSQWSDREDAKQLILSIDMELGAPVRFEVVFGNGKSIVTTYGGFEDLSGGYLEQVWRFQEQVGPHNPRGFKCGWILGEENSCSAK